MSRAASCEPRGAPPRARALLAALALLTAARLPGGAAEDAADDDDSDSAPFMIVVELVGGEQLGQGAAGRCSGSLVSLRTGVTSAECARGRGPAPPRELWALAAATAAGLAPRVDGARRVSRVATAGPARADPSDAAAWDDPLLDLAVLELQRPFGSGARARPILMATAPQECAGSGVCHVVRSLRARARSGLRLRIVDAELAADAVCAAAVRHWAALRERALCLAGPELCAAERGAGVVCGGKLCGVVSRVAGGPDDCGRTLAAQAVARWRRFLHCAHTLRACGSGACAELCSEQRLLTDSEEGEQPAPTPALTSTPAPPPDARPLAELVDLAHLAPPGDESVLPPPPPPPPPTRVHSYPPAPAARTSRTRKPALLRGSHGRKPTRTHWTTTSTTPLPLAVPAEWPPAPAPAVQPPPPAQAVQAPPPAPAVQAPPPAPAVQAPPPAPAARLPPPAPTSPPLSPATTSTMSPPPTPPPPPPPASVRLSPLFEPNRPDFRAGEYGDNAAEYGALADEAPATVSTPSTLYVGPGAPRTVASAATARRGALDARRTAAAAARVAMVAPRTAATAARTAPPSTTPPPPPVPRAKLSSTTPPPPSSAAPPAPVHSWLTMSCPLLLLLYTL